MEKPKVTDGAILRSLFQPAAPTLLTRLWYGHIALVTQENGISSRTQLKTVKSPIMWMINWLQVERLRIGKTTRIYPWTESGKKYLLFSHQQTPVKHPVAKCGGKLSELTQAWTIACLSRSVLLTWAMDRQVRTSYATSTRISASVCLGRRKKCR